jgi:Flp pilus assembly protein TadG
MDRGASIMSENPKGRIVAITARWFQSTVKRLVRQQDGGVAIEFAMVAAPFIALLFAIIETAIVFFASQSLEAAAADSARLVMTGQAQSQGFDAAKYKEAVCAKIYAIFNCNGGMTVDVRTFANFSSVDTSKPVDANGNVNLTAQYQPGGPGDIVLVRLLYQYPVWVNLFGYSLSNVSGGKHLMVATSAFRNEPYK